MVFKHFTDLRPEKGISLVELIIVIFLITLLSSILIADFPKMQRHFALSRAAYKLAQDLRRAQDFGFSGVIIKDGQENSVEAKGYGLYVSTLNNTQYFIYADVDGDAKYSSLSQTFCNKLADVRYDCIMEKTDISEDNSDLYIKELKNIIGNYTSINFYPPSPTINIENRCLLCGNSFQVGIVLSLNSDPESTRTVWINTSGLIRVE